MPLKPRTTRVCAARLRHALGVRSGLFLLAVMASTVAIAGRAPEQTMTLDVAGHSNEYVSLASADRLVAAAWAATLEGKGTDIYLALSRDAGGSFSAPVRVNEVPRQAQVNGEQPPRVVFVPRGSGAPDIVVVWTAKGSSGTSILTARSSDGGRTFGKASVVGGSDAPGNRGWESVAANRSGSILTLWLDHRDLTPKPGVAAMNHAEHQHVPSGENTADGFTRAQLSQLFAARLGDARSGRSVARGVCYCCKTALASDDAGGFYAAWREVYEGNIRDIAFAKSTDGGRTFSAPVRVSDDNWVLDGCPENGPAIAVDAAKRIHVVWPTLVPAATPNGPPTLALFYATSVDGRRFTPRQRIPTEGVPRHPQIALGSSRQLMVVWDEQSSGTRNIALARGTIDEHGTARFSRGTVRDSVPGNYPFVAATDSGTIIGWTSGASGKSVIRTRRLQ